MPSFFTSGTKHNGILEFITLLCRYRDNPTEDYHCAPPPSLLGLKLTIFIVTECFRIKKIAAMGYDDLVVHNSVIITALII